MVAVKRGEFLLGNGRPFRAQLPETLHPSLAILSLETCWLPGQEEPSGRKQCPDAAHEFFFAGARRW